MLTFIGVAPDVPWATFWRVVGVAWLWAGILIVIGLALSVPTPLAGEQAMLDALAEWQTEGRTTVVRRLSGLGNVWIVGTGSLVLATILHLRGARLAAEFRLLVIAAYGGALVITAPLKLLTARARPSGALVGTLSSAYPSGHALRTAAVYGALIWILARLARTSGQRVGVAVLLVALVMAIAAARVYLWVHWPSDVAVGVLLGGIWTGLTLRITRPLRPAAGWEKPAAEPRPG